MDTRNRAILFILAVILLMASVFIGIALYEYRLNNHERTENHEKALAFLVESQFKKLTQEYSSRINGFIRSNHQITDTFGKRERSTLIKLLKSRFNTLKKENPDFYDIKFLLPDGTLFLSMHDLNNYGMDLSLYKYVKALKSGTRSLHGFIVTKDKLFFQSAQNIYSGGKMVGSIEFMIKTDDLNRMIKKVLGSEYALAVLITPASKNDGITETSIIDKSSSLFDKFPEHFNYSRSINTIQSGRYSYQIYSKPVYDFQGEKIAYYLTSSDTTSRKERFRSFFIFTLVVTGGVIVLTTLVLYAGFGSILKKIEQMNANLEKTVDLRTRELNEAKNKAEAQSKLINSMYKRFKNMFQDHHSIMLLIDPVEGWIVDANNAALSFFKQDKKAMQEMKISDVSLLPESDVSDILSKCSTEGLKDYVAKFHVPGGVVDLELQASPIEIENQRMLFAICHDVTEKISIENELKDLNKDLEKKVDEEVEKRKQQELLLIQQSKMSSMGEILSIIIHQWKQPMTALSYLMQDIVDSAERGTADPAYIEEIAGEALGQINYMNQTVEDFRRFLMPSKTKEDFNVAENVIGTLRLIGKQIEKEGIDFNITLINIENDAVSYKLTEIMCNEELGICISCFTSNGYPNEFKQVLMNIINNARDAIKHQEPNSDFTGHINLMVSCEINIITLSISDNAGGIPKDILPRIFEPYFTTKSIKGTGIGLYMAKSIIENHMGGSITADNSDKGALFTITLQKK